MMYYNKSVKEVISELDSNIDGLTTKETKKRLEKYGYNKIEEAKGKSHFQIFIEQFKDTMIIVLIVTAIFMFIYGLLYSHDYTDTIVIVVVVLFNSIIGFIQEKRAEVTLKGLKKYSNSVCKVMRDKKKIIVSAEELVVGDIIFLEPGDKLSADVRIIECSNLSVDESALTGESVAVSKVNKVLKGKKILQDQNNMLFCGSLIVKGTCTGIVVNTGMNTELGSIAKSLNTPYEVETPLQVKMKEISNKLTFLIFIIIILIFIYGVIKNYKLMEIIMLCVSLAVALIPEGLPAVITICLSNGANFLMKKNIVIRQMSAVETLGSMDVICSDKTGTITQNKMKVKEVITNDSKMLNYIMLLANETIIDNDELIGDPTETCMYQYLIDNNIDINTLKDNCPRVINAEFDSERKMHSSVNKVDEKYYLFTKGSLDSILARCNIKNKENVKKDELKLADSALRVIGFAYKELDKVPKNYEEVISEEDNLTYVGMVGIIDPPRENVKSAVSKCKIAGIRPIMITGDSLITACAIAKTVGIIKSNEEGILGSDLDNYTDEELKTVVNKYNVYARVTPEHKSRIVRAIQKNNKVVAMTGDGVNDAIAVKEAHVGIGMGITGTEVTKATADIILLDDSFATIVDGVEEGRRIFCNIRNNIVYSLSSNFAELFIVLIGIFTNNTILLPIHILFIDLVTDTIPSICLSFEGEPKGIMKEKPRGINKSVFTPFIKANIAYSSILEAILALITFFVSKSITLTLFTVVVQEILYAISCRNLKETFYKQGIFSNKIMNLGIFIIIIIELLVFMTPLGNLIDIDTLNISTLILITMYNIIGLFLYEVAKPILRKLFKD